jgi:hypothetical protein
VTKGADKAGDTRSVLLELVDSDEDTVRAAMETNREERDSSTSETMAIVTSHLTSGVWMKCDREL